MTQGCSVFAGIFVLDLLVFLFGQQTLIEVCVVANVVTFTVAWLVRREQNKLERLLKKVYQALPQK